MDPRHLELVYIARVDLIQRAIPGIRVVTAILGPLVTRLRKCGRRCGDRCQAYGSGRQRQSEILHGNSPPRSNSAPAASATVCFCKYWFRRRQRSATRSIRQPIDRRNDFCATASASQIEYFGVAFVNSDACATSCAAASDAAQQDVQQKEQQSKGSKVAPQWFGYQSAISPARKNLFHLRREFPSGLFAKGLEQIAIGGRIAVLVRVAVKQTACACTCQRLWSQAGCIHQFECVGPDSRGVERDAGLIPSRPDLAQLRHSGSSVR